MFDNQGNVKKTKDQYDRALKIYKTELGPDHIKSMNVIRNLGNIYHYYRAYDIAISHYQQALTVNKAAFGETHPTSAIILTLLALLIVGPHFLGLVTTNAAEGYTSEFFANENSFLEHFFAIRRLICSGASVENF